MRDQSRVRMIAVALLGLSVGACAIDTETSWGETTVESAATATACAEPDVDIFHVKAVAMAGRWLSYFEVPRDQRRGLDYTIDFLARTSEPVAAWTCETLPGPGGWYCSNGKKYAQCVHYESGPSCDTGKVDPDTNPSGCGA
jgi:hypothetical protein